MGDTGIQWTDKTNNPIRARNILTGKVGWFCEHASPGCDNCYAETMNLNTYFGNGLPYKVTARPQLELFLDEKMLTAPLRWRDPKRIFMCSMTDLFGRFVPDEWIDRIFAVMALAPQHTFQILTKRPERMRAYLSAGVEQGRKVAIGSASVWTHGASWPLPNVWLGVSAENADAYKRRVIHLANTPAAVRFISFEPLLGDIGDLMLDGICKGAYHWGIIGGESGKLARPCDVQDVYGVLDQLKAAGVAPFVKQLGKEIYISPGAHRWRNSAHDFTIQGGIYLNSKKGDDPSEWPEDLRVREFPESKVIR